MAKIRIGLIGCGGISAGHARRIAQLPDAEVAALCDINPEAFSRLASRAPSVVGLPTYEDYRDMLDSVSLDAVEILTPHTLHYEHIMTSIDAGKHVLVEKPMVCTTEHAKNVIRHAHECNKVVLVSYQRHYQRPYLFLKDLIMNDVLGTIQCISALQSQNWLHDQRGKWRQVPELSGGGQLNDSGSHLLDILLWVTGLQPEIIFATTEYFDAQVDINTGMTFRCTNGAIVNIAIVGNGADFWEDVTIWGSKGVAYYRNGTVRVKVRGEEGERVPSNEPDETNPDKNFVDAILGRATVKSRPEDAYHVIQLTESVWESARLGKPVGTDSSDETSNGVA